MKKLRLVFIWLCTLQSAGLCQYATFSKQSHGTNPITIPNGEIWQIHSWNSSGNIDASNLRGRLGTNSGEIYLRGTSGYYYSMDNAAAAGSANYAVGVIITGPATFENMMPSENYYLVLKKVVSGTSTNSISSTSVVIPQSAVGDVDIKLEQSADNVTWTECLPGTYNSSTVKRFFRLRAVEK
jgi:hypothetical protein